MKKQLLFILLLCTPLFVQANFIAMNRGARAYAMGNAYTALADDATAVFWNPAGLARTDKLQFIISHQNLYGIDDLYNEMAAVAIPTKFVRLGLGWKQLHYLGEYYEQEITLSAASIMWFKKIPLRFGLSLKHLRAKADYNGAESPRAIDLDAGFIVNPKKAFSIGFCAKNLLNNEMKFFEISDPVETEYSFGLSYNWQNILIVSADNIWRDDKEQWNLGGEMWFYDVFAPRLGVQGENLTAGFGLKTTKWRLDAAILADENLGSTYRLDFGMFFENFLEKRN